jgi:hypothetical protein
VHVFILLLHLNRETEGEIIIINTLIVILIGYVLIATHIENVVLHFCQTLQSFFGAVTDSYNCF